MTDDIAGHDEDGRQFRVYPLDPTFVTALPELLREGPLGDEAPLAEPGRLLVLGRPEDRLLTSSDVALLRLCEQTKPKSGRHPLKFDHTKGNEI